MVFEHRKHLIPMFLIEPWCLAVVGVEDHVLTSPGSRFLLCCLEELGPYSLSPKALTLSSRFAGRTHRGCSVVLASDSMHIFVVSERLEPF